MTRTWIVAAAAAAFSLAPRGAEALSKQVASCYSTCNRTVPGKQERNQCFKDCRAAPAGETVQEDRGEVMLRGQTRKCAVQCSRKFEPGMEEHAACVKSCQPSGKQRTAASRFSAESERIKAEKQLNAQSGGTCQRLCRGCHDRWHGDTNPGNCRSDCKAVLGEYNSVHAMLRTGAKVKPGVSGHLSGRTVQGASGQSYNELAAAKGQLERAMSSCDFDDAVPYMRTIEQEWKSSLGASRRQGD